MSKIKGLFSIATLAFAVYFFAGCNHSGSDFEGVVSYGVSADSKMPAEVSAMFQTMVLKTYVKGTKTRTEQSMPGNKNVIIADSKDSNSPVVLIDMFGGKYAVRQNDSLKKIAEQHVPKIEYIDSAGSEKQIAGYKCKKARCTFSTPNSGPMTTEVYYSEALPYADPQGNFKGLKGMPMEFSMDVGNMNIILSARSVDKQKLSDSLFVVPAEYKLMDIKELQATIMKQMSKSMDTSSGNSAPNP